MAARLRAIDLVQSRFQAVDRPVSLCRTSREAASAAVGLKESIAMSDGEVAGKRANGTH
jgi:hypothetical protein